MYPYHLKKNNNNENIEQNNDKIYITYLAKFIKQ